MLTQCTYTRTYIHTYMHTYILACMYTCIVTDIHTRIHTYIHTYIYGMRRAKESMKSPQSKKIPKTSQIQQSESLEKLLSRYKAIVTLRQQAPPKSCTKPPQRSSSSSLFWNWNFFIGMRRAKESVKSPQSERKPISESSRQKRGRQSHSMIMAKDFLRRSRSSTQSESLEDLLSRSA